MLLDTDFVINVMRMVPRAQARFEALLDEDVDLAISTMTLVELYHGLGRLDGAPRERERIERMVHRLDPVPLDAPIAAKAGVIHGTLARGGRPIAIPDAIIAATALARDEELLSLNHRHFARVPDLRLADV